MGSRAKASDVARPRVDPALPVMSRHPSTVMISDDVAVNHHPHLNTTAEGNTGVGVPGAPVFFLCFKSFWTYILQVTPLFSWVSTRTGRVQSLPTFSSWVSTTNHHHQPSTAHCQWPPLPPITHHHHPPTSKTSAYARFRRWWVFCITTTLHLPQKRARMLVFGVGGCPTLPPPYHQPRKRARMLVFDVGG